MRYRTFKGLEIDGKSGGYDVGASRKAPAKLDMASEELDKHVGAENEDEYYHIIR